MTVSAVSNRIPWPYPTVPDHMEADASLAFPAKVQYPATFLTTWKHDRM